MKNNKGFTLIELLAVIVILAIIALIASPIIIGLIDDARKEAAASSAHGIVGAAQNVFAKVLIKNKNGLGVHLKYDFETPDTIQVSTDGSTWTDVEDPADLGVDADTITLDYNGTKPTEGILIIDNKGDVTIGEEGLTISNFKCTYENKQFECEN